MTKRLLTSGEAADLLGMSPKEFSKWAPKLPSVREGGGWRYYFREDVKAFREFLSPAVATDAPEPQVKGRKSSKSSKSSKDFWE